MKTIKQQREVEVFVCEGCGKDFLSPYLAAECEQFHKPETCQHRTKKYTVVFGDIHLKCLECELSEMVLDVETLSSDQLAAIVKLIQEPQP